VEPSATTSGNYPSPSTSTTFDDPRLQRIIGPLPHTALADGVAATVDRFRHLAARGLVDAGGLA